MRYLPLALLALSCSPAVPEGPLGDAELATVAILRPVGIDLPDDEAPTAATEYAVVCGGVAVSAHRIVTAAHCFPDGGGWAGYVTRSEWFAHSDTYETGTLRLRPELDLATIDARDKLVWGEWREPVQGETATVISPLGDYAHSSGVVDLLGADLFSVDVRLAPGISGSPAFGSDGRLLGVALSCAAPDGACVSPGRFRTIERAP